MRLSCTRLLVIQIWTHLLRIQIGPVLDLFRLGPFNINIEWAHLILFQIGPIIIFTPLGVYLFGVSWRHISRLVSRGHATSGCHTQGNWRPLHQDPLAYTACSPDYHQKFKYPAWLFVETTKQITRDEYLWKFWIRSPMLIFRKCWICLHYAGYFPPMLDIVRQCWIFFANAGVAHFA